MAVVYQRSAQNTGSFRSGEQACILYAAIFVSKAGCPPNPYLRSKEDLHGMVGGISTFLLRFGDETLFYAWKPILIFASKALGLKNFFVLRISHLLLKSVSIHDLNRVGQESRNR